MFAPGDICVWRGQQAKVLCREQVTTAAGDVKWCLNIQVLELPAFKGLRYVSESACGAIHGREGRK